MSNEKYIQCLGGSIPSSIWRGTLQQRSGLLCWDNLALRWSCSVSIRTLYWPIQIHRNRMCCKMDCGLKRFAGRILQRNGEAAVQNCCAAVRYLQSPPLYGRERNLILVTINIPMDSSLHTKVCMQMIGTVYYMYVFMFVCI